ncbi:hypothetical protein T231_14385 [Tannerella sp. oral taxon BU063 isolate Cell 6/7/9]|uniref:Uncharacterized protein n=1 Tax=Tannerella sp. oral taxon BU063 isolate Cell 6/7/9 TaxID=1411021 RepID=W2CNR1_9BACT|nr:hypothetical protein T231_14385 [Tannerella sp. oral taxon BU063 isolate Cell 6/7/9]
MQSGTAMHGQAASALSEMRSKYILNPSKLSSLGRGLRKPEQVLDWLRAVCADPNRHSIGFAQCARLKTGTRLASRSVRGSKQALDWGVRDASQVCRVQSKFHLILVPGKLSQPRQRPARSKTDERPPPMIDPATKDRILEAAQIVDVVSEFVTLRKRRFL